MSSRNKTTKQLASVLAIPLFLGFSASSLATNGILPLGNGMTAHGLGGAGIANAADAMSGVDNPALLADTGDQMAVGLTLFSPHRSADVGQGAGYVDSDKNMFPIPAFGWTKVLDPNMNVGILVTAMGGMNTSYPAKLLEPFLGPNSEEFGMDMSGLIIAPTISYAPSKEVSYGAALLYGYEKLTTTLPSAMPFEDGTDTATGTGIRVGFKLALDESMTFGGFYQSRIKMGEMSKHCDNGAFAGAKQMGVVCEVNLAPITGFGFKINTSESSKVVLDLIDVAWSQVDLFQNAFGWSDQEILKVGFESKSSDTFTWRIGYNYAQQPVNPEALIVNEGPAQQMPGIMAPAVSESHYTVGFTQKMGNNELVGYYAYVPEVEVKDPTAGAKVKMYQHALGFGYNWK